MAVGVSCVIPHRAEGSLLKKLIGLYSLTDGGYAKDLGKSMRPANCLLHDQRAPEYRDAEKAGSCRIHENASGQQLSGSARKWTSSFFIIRPFIEFNMAASAGRMKTVSISLSGT